MSWGALTMAKTQYEVSGTRHQLNSLGVPESFQQVVTAESAREAFMTVIGDPKFERTLVVAIKIECPTCAGFHLTIPTEYYL
jgi:hypothetical protein